jgi:hypothetical protein
MRRVMEVKDPSLAFVEAPRCEACGEELDAYSELMWVCGNERCVSFGCARRIPGVYPIILKIPAGEHEAEAADGS